MLKRLAFLATLSLIASASAAYYRVTTDCPTVNVIYTTSNGTEQLDDVKNGWSLFTLADDLSMSAQANGNCTVQAIIERSNETTVQSRSKGKFVVASVNTQDSFAPNPNATVRIPESPDVPRSAGPKPVWAKPEQPYILGSALLKSGLMTVTAAGYIVEACGKIIAITKSGDMISPRQQTGVGHIEQGRLYITSSLFDSSGCLVGLGGLPQSVTLSWGDDDKNIFPLESRYW